MLVQEKQDDMHQHQHFLCKLLEHSAETNSIVKDFYSI